MTSDVVSAAMVASAGATVTVSTAKGQSFSCAEGDTILRGALRAGHAANYECNSGGCGTCRFTPSSGEFVQLQSDPKGLSERDRRRGRLLACQSVPTSDCTVDLLEGDWLAGHVRPRQIAAEVVGSRMLTHDLRELTLQGPGPARFLPGQFAMLSPVATGKDGYERAAERAYSMSNLANPDGVWQFLIKRVPTGAASGRFVDEVQVGDSILLDGPYGFAHLHEGDRDVVCIAGGSGLAPMVSIARGLAAKSTGAAHGERRLTFFYGGRREEDLCAEEFCLEVAPSLGGLELIEALSGDVDDAWQGRRGFIHDVIRATQMPGFNDREFYVAGPPVMTDAVVQLLVIELQIPADRVHFDRFF